MTTTPAQRKSRADRRGAAVRISPNFPKTSSRKERAAMLLAEDELTDEAIAEEVGVTKRTITNWKQDPEFASLVGDYHGKIVAQALKLPIARKHYRVSVLNDLHERALDAIDHREHMADQDDSPTSHAMRIFGDHVAPEAATGLFVAKQSVSASGKVVTDWVFDAALVKEIRDLEKQAAQELGQWEDRAALDVNHVVREYVGINPEDV